MKKRELDHSKYQDWIDPKDVFPYEKNAKQHDDKQIKNIANSIRRFGWQQDTVITADNVLVIGHGRRLAAMRLGCQMPYHRIDKVADELTDDDIKELRIADNLTNESPWDVVLRDAEMQDLGFDGFDFDFGFTPEEVAGELEEKYTMKVNIPQYEPTGEKPEISELYDTDKEQELLDHIMQAEGITEEERQFLIYAAHRHNVFNYRNIAEYYAQSGPEMQKLMEESALVIIDVDDAIAMGYARLADDIRAMIEDGEADEE